MRNGVSDVTFVWRGRPRPRLLILGGAAVHLSSLMTSLTVRYHDITVWLSPALHGEEALGKDIDLLQQRVAIVNQDATGDADQICRTRRAGRTRASAPTRVFPGYDFFLRE